MAQQVYRVGQVNAYIKNIFSQDDALRQIAVKGEVSNCKYHTSGQIYFPCQDEPGVLQAGMFAGQRSGLRFSLKEGQKVIVCGSIMVYERNGSYQLYAREIQPDGLGELYLRFEELKQRLEEMGMFASEYKQPIPTFAHRVGIVTASTGAAIRDMVNIAHRRNPFVQLILYPAIVQGEQAAPSIVRGISVLDEMGLDCLIVGRGGGSMEDLWAFNEESVARAIFDAQTPIISAVGHETDTTIADFVADLRAPTPSAAAELAVYDVHSFLHELQKEKNHLSRLMWNALQEKQLRLEQNARRLERRAPHYQLEQKRQVLLNAEAQLTSGIEDRIQEERHRLAVACTRLEGLSPLQKLQQGYAYVSDDQGKTLKSVQQTMPGGLLKITLQDGHLLAQIKEKIVHDDAERRLL